MIVVGITGKNCSGKDAVADLLEARGYERHSFSDVLRDELRLRGTKITRAALTAVGNELRRAEGPAVLAKRLKAKMRGERVVLVSVRSPSEVASLREIDGFTLLGVEAPVEVRFNRHGHRGREGAVESLKAFRAEEAAENTDDEHAQQLDRTLALADVVIRNDGTLDDLKQRVLAFLEGIDG